MYQKSTLENGLRVLTSSMPALRSVSVNFFIGTGSRYETDRRAGISHFIEHLSFKGTRKRPTGTDICSVIEGVGGLFNGGTDKEITLYWTKVAREHLPLALDVLSDMLLNSRFDPADIERERQVIIEEISMARDTPSQRVSMLIDELLWPHNPLGRDVAGTRQSVSRMSRNMILDHHRRFYQPSNIVVAVAGNVKHEAIVDAISDTLGKWTAKVPHPSYTPWQGGMGRRVVIENRDTEQTQVSLALPGIPVNDPRRFALDLMNIILGEGMSSRLFTQIRDKLGLAYSINSYTEHFLDTGAIEVNAGVDVRNLRVAISAILEELRKLKEPLPEAEIMKAKELSRGRLSLRLEDSRSVAGWIGGQEVLTGQVLTFDDVIKAIRAVTREQICQLANDLLVGDQLRLSVVGPVPEDEPLEDLLQL